MAAARRPAKVTPTREFKLAKPITVSWEAVFQLPVAASNAFVLGVTQAQDGEHEEYILSFGFLPTPPVWGTPEQQIEQAGRLESVAVMPVGRITFSKKRLAELHAILGSVLDGKL
jgi:hypothetical protein